VSEEITQAINDTLRVVVQQLELSQDETADLWIHAMYGGDDPDQPHRWNEAWTFAESVTDRRDT
jgi:hypothetical protein